VLAMDYGPSAMDFSQYRSSLRFGAGLLTLRSRMHKGQKVTNMSIAS
jgi:hypothetical protein